MPTRRSPASPAKPAVKATPAPKAPRASTGRAGPLFDMPKEVSDWIERAQSIMNHQRGEIERLKVEITDLKAYKKWAENRILRSDHE